MTEPPRILGIVNITDDSFSDGGDFRGENEAVAHANSLLDDGADVIDIGAAASNPDALPVPTDEEIARLDPVITAMHARGATVSIDTFNPNTQRHALSRGVATLNDIHGFPDASVYPALAASDCKLILMHSVHRTSRVTTGETGLDDIEASIAAFFEARLAAFDRAGIARGRVILDPGMGYFLGPDPETSFSVLRNIAALKSRFSLPVLISVTRKSFLRKITGRPEPKRSGAASLAAELFAATQGVDFIRTHDVAALRDGLKIWRAASG